MITYVPFLKAKSNEIIAVGELAPTVKSATCPFFDYPRKPNLDENTFKAGVEKMTASLRRHLGYEYEFYFDNYDLDDRLRLGRKHNYGYLLEALSDFLVIPVISVDRSASHLGAVAKLKAEGKIQADVVAVRFTPDDFETYAVIEDDIVNELEPVIDLFTSVDLIFDCRVCTGLDPSVVSVQINRFSQNFCKAYNVRRIILTGSSIPAAAREVLNVQTERTIHRHELDIYRATKTIHTHHKLTFGDYTTVSPMYSDLDLAPEILQNVMTAKFVYTLNDSHFFIRGGGLKVKGRGQYYFMAYKLCSKPFFRGANFSTGDEYFHQKSQGLGSTCGPNTVIKPSVNSHISYVVLSGIS